MGILKCFAKVIELLSSLVFILGAFTLFFAISLARKIYIYIHMQLIISFFSCVY